MSNEKINNLTAAIATATRRKEHLERRIDNRSPNYADSASAEFDRAEMSMLDKAIKCMREHQALVGYEVVVYRRSITDLATDVRALFKHPDELTKFVEALHGR